MWSDSSDYERETISGVIKAFDFEASTLERLNLLPTASTEYLHGDFLRFELPDQFKEYVCQDKEQISEIAYEQIGDWSSHLIPKKLKKNLEEALEWCQREAQREWLHGDRSNDGVLTQLAKALFGRHTDAEIEWDTKTDTVYINASEEDWRYWYDCDLDERDTLPEPLQIAEAIKQTVLNEAEKAKEKRIKASEARKGVWERAEATRKAQEEAEREAAKERKRLKDQAT